MIVYSTDCPLCKKLLKRLDESNIQYEICTDEQVMENKGINQVPTLETDAGELLSYNKADKYLKESANL